MSRRCDAQLALIAEVAAVCGALGIDCWLRGGWAMDFYLGRVTREHSDVDWLLWVEDADRLVDALEQHEYQRTPEHPADQQLDFVWHGEVVSFALLAATTRAKSSLPEALMPARHGLRLCWRRRRVRSGRSAAG